MREKMRQMILEITGYIRCRSFTPEANRTLQTLMRTLLFAFDDGNTDVMEWLFSKIKEVPRTIMPEAGGIVGVEFTVHKMPIDS